MTTKQSQSIVGHKFDQGGNNTVQQKRNLNALLPINQLPPEILGDILLAWAWRWRESDCQSSVE